MLKNIRFWAVVGLLTAGVYFAANASVCFLPDGGCDLGNTGGISEIYPDDPDDSCAGYGTKSTPEECYDCMSCTKNGTTLYKCTLKQGYGISGRTCKRICPSTHPYSEQIDNAKCTKAQGLLDCYKCECNKGYEKENRSGSCVAYCTGDYRYADDSLKNAGYTCSKDATKECYKCVCEGVENAGACTKCESGEILVDGVCKNDKCIDGYSKDKPSCGEGKHYETMQTDAGTTCYSACYDDCQYQYRHAIGNDVYKNGDTSHPQSITSGSTGADYGRLTALNTHGDIYLHMPSGQIYGIYNRIKEGANSCTRKVDNLYGEETLLNVTDNKITFYQEICPGIPENVCKAKGSSWKFEENGCSSGTYEFAQNTAYGSKFGDCTKQCQNGSYVTEEECKTHITDANNQYCVNDDGCYKVTGNPNVAYVSYSSGVGMNVISGGQSCSYSGGCTEGMVMAIFDKTPPTTPVYTLSRSRKSINPGTYYVCIRRNNSNGGSGNCGTGVGFAYMSLSNGASTEFHGIDCAYPAPTDCKSDMDALSGCVSYTFEKGKTYTIGAYWSYLYTSSATYSCSPMDDRW